VNARSIFLTEKHQFPIQISPILRSNVSFLLKCISTNNFHILTNEDTFQHVLARATKLIGANISSKYQSHIF